MKHPLPLLNKIDNLLKICKSCEKKDWKKHSHETCEGCKTYLNLKEIGNEIERVSAVAKLSLAEYRDYKAKGMKDRDIAKRKGLTPNRVSQLKKEWNEKAQKPVTSASETSEGKTMEEEIKAESAPFEEDRTTKLEFENEQLRKDNNNLVTNLMDSRDKVIKQDYVIENQKQALTNTRKVLEQYEDENRSLRTVVRELVKMWM
jgi:hypothetical protein